jgi:hypothetical protein
MKKQTVDGTIGFLPYFDIRHDHEGRVFSYTRRLFFTSKEMSWHAVLSKAEWILSCRMLAEGLGHFKISKDGETIFSC